jgi:hypothetical protein
MTSLDRFYTAVSRAAASPNVYQRIDNIVTSIETLAVPTQKQTTKGILLEVSFHETILMRLQTVRYAEKSISLDQLLSVESYHLGENQALVAIMEMELEEFDIELQQGENQGLPSLKTNTD